MRLGALALLVVAPVAHAATLALPPHVAELRPDGFVVAFETDVDTDASVDVAPAAAPFQRAGTSHGRVHRIRVTSLAPGEAVTYRVVADGKTLAEAHSHAGPPDSATALDFLVYGDTRDGPAAEHTLALEARAFAPVVVVHTGDIVPRGNDEASWRELFTTERPLFEETPMYLALGNHEFVGDPDGTLARRYMPPPGDGPAYYTFRTGPVRFVVLDSTRLDEKQTQWLATTLGGAANEPGKPHVFVFLHHPPFSTGGHCGSLTDEPALVDLFERYRPSAVFAGHDHAYERLERNGVRYFVSGGGGAPLYAENAWCSAEDQHARRVYRAAHHVVRVRVRGEAVEIEAVELGGAPIDTVRFSRDEPLTPEVTVPDTARPTRLARVLGVAGGVLLIAAIVVGLRRLLVARRDRS